MDERRRFRIALRLAAAGLVVAWFFVPRVRYALPFWPPFVILLAAEAEFLVRGVLEARRGRQVDPSLQIRRAPGLHDADLGWGTLVEEIGPEGSYLRLEPPPLRPPRRTSRIAYLVGAGVAAAVFVAAFTIDRGQTWASLASEDRAAIESRLVREVGLIAGRPVTVRCDDTYSYTGVGSDALGVAFPRRALAFIAPDICFTLSQIIERARESAAATEAVVVLAHEAVHLRGELREGVTECLALQEGVELGARLGFAPAVARRMMAAAYAERLAERSITRVSYALPPGCRDGGDLDVKPSEAGFP